MSDSLEKTSDLLTSLIFGERPERFAHIAHQKEGMSESLIFLTNLTYIKNTILDFLTTFF